MRTERRCIKKTPDSILYYLIDANFLINKYLQLSWITESKENNRVVCCQDYWKIIDKQLSKEKAKIFILDICIAEVYKILSKKYYQNYFPTFSSYNWVCAKIRRDIGLSYTNAKKYERKIQYHDIQLNRDIIIGVDRFFENIHKKNANVSIVDISILSTAKYLIDFFGFTHNNLFIITMDNELYKIGKQFQDLPYVFNPNNPNDKASNVFIE